MFPSCLEQPGDPAFQPSLSRAHTSLNTVSVCHQTLGTLRVVSSKVNIGFFILPMVPFLVTD